MIHGNVTTRQPPCARKARAPMQHSPIVSHQQLYVICESYEESNNNNIMQKETREVNVIGRERYVSRLKSEEVDIARAEELVHECQQRLVVLLHLFPTTKHSAG